MKQPHTHINGYLVEGVWSQGGMSTLWLGQNPITHEHLLIKTPSKDACKDFFIQERLQKEADILKQCNHPNIVTLLHHGVSQDVPFLALEFLRGVSLRNILDQHPVPLKKALTLLVELCSAIRYLHERKVAHRDLKPENIFITDDGHAKIIDFGLAAPLNTNQKSDMFEGTPFYMSPEAIQDSSLATATRDIYALGMLAYEMILGRITHGKVLLAFLPKGLQKVIAKALQPDPKDRYQTVDEFQKMLEIYIQSSFLDTERHGSDYFFDIFEQSSCLEKELHETLSFREIESCSIVTKCSIHTYGEYVASLKTQEEVGFVVIEFLEKGIKGLLISYVCHYLLSSLTHLPLQERFQRLQQLLEKDFSVRASYCIVHEKKKKLFCHQAEGSCFFLSKKGEEYREIKEEETLLQQEDRILCIGFEPTIEQKTLQTALDETSLTPISQQADVLFQKLQIKKTWREGAHPVCLVVLLLKREE